MRVMRLTPPHVIKDFDCDDVDLNDFLHSNAKDFQQSLLSVTYLLEDDTHTIAFYSLLNDKITFEDFTNKEWKTFRERWSQRKKFKSYPAMKIGRLGVHKNFKGCGYGRQILDYLKQLFVDNNRTGCKFITVDAYSESIQFYEKNGFVYFTKEDINKDTRQMYFQLDQLT